MKLVTSSTAAPADTSEDRASDGALLENVLTFIALLRRGGLAVTPGQTLDFLAALEYLDLGQRRQVHQAGRALLVTRREDLRLYDTLFARFFSAKWAEPTTRPQRAPRAPRHDEPREKPFTIVNYMAYKARKLDREVDVADRAGTFTDVEVLQRKDFSRLDPLELRAVRRLIQDKGINLTVAEVDVTHEKASDEEGPYDRFHRTLRLEGDLDEAVRARMVEIADRCPVHRTLHGRVVVENTLI